MIALRVSVTVLALTLLLGCQKAYYDTMEKFGVHKRDILVDRVEEARDSQEEVKDQFQSALERFDAVVGVPEGDLKDKYEELQAVLDRSEDKAAELRKRIAAVEEVAEALFEEWKDELELYSDDSLRRSSEQKLRQTRRQYQQLITAMKRAEDKIDPVLVPLRDQVLYLKHNLNAQAIASLQQELQSVEADVAALVREMEVAMAEAEAFIREMEKG